MRFEPGGALVGWLMDRHACDDSFGLGIGIGGSVALVEDGVWAAVILAGGSGRRLGGPGKPTLPVAGRPMLARVLAAVSGAAPLIVVGPAQLARQLPDGVLRIQEDTPGSGPVSGLAAGLQTMAATDPGLGRLPAMVGGAADGGEFTGSGASGRSGDALAPDATPASPARGRGGSARETPATLDRGGGGLVRETPAGSDRGGGGLVRETPARSDRGGQMAVLAADLPLLTPAAIQRLRTALDKSSADGAVYVDGAGRRQWLCGVWRPEALGRRVGEFGDPVSRSLRELLSPLRIVDVSGPVGEPPPWYDCDTADDLRAAEEWIDERTGGMGRRGR
jgi:molybdopterin-guanine dinucleotide biosynthesis protein A